MPDRVWRHKPAIEVHAFDLGVDRDDGRPVAEVDHCRIVSDADDYLPRVAVEFEAWTRESLQRYASRSQPTLAVFLHAS